MKYPIGTKFKTRGKSPRECEVIDIHTTFNHKGELVKTRYVSVHSFLGQRVVTHDLPETTITMGLMT
jgi:hypothetical protein